MGWEVCLSKRLFLIFPVTCRIAAALQGLKWLSFKLMGNACCGSSDWNTFKNAHCEGRDFRNELESVPSSQLQNTTTPDLYYHTRSMRAPVWFPAGGEMHFCIIVAHTRVGKQPLLKQFYIPKKCYKTLPRNIFVFTFGLVFFGQSKHSHIIMYWIFSINSNTIFTFPQIDLLRFLLTLITCIAIAARSLQISAQWIGPHCTNRCYKAPAPNWWQRKSEG